MDQYSKSTLTFAVTEGGTGSPSESGPSGIKLSDLRDLTFIVAIFVFFAGFIYRYYYLTYLGISPSAVETSYNSTLVYGFSVFYSNAGWLIVIGAAAIVTGILLAKAPRISGFVRKQRAYFLVPLIALLFVGLFVGASRTAQLSVLQVKLGQSDAINRVTLTFKPGHSNYPKDVLTAMTNGAALLLTAQRDKLYLLIRQDPLPGSRNLPDMSVYVVSTDDVANYSTLVPGCHACVPSGGEVP